MKLKRVIFLFTNGPRISPELLQLGKSVGAQFRNSKLVDQENPEHCDYVMGEVIPECYQDKPVFSPETAAEELSALSDQITQAGSEKPHTDTSADLDGATLGDDSGSITMEYLKSLDKAGLIKLANEEDIELTAAEKKSPSKMVAAIAEAFDLQE